jgi:hypothetical protein
VDFPLRGERWVAVNTPGDRVPSHGTDMLGQRFAYDLLMVDTRRGLRYHPAGILRGFLIGVRTRDCYAWGAAIHAPFDGEIVQAGRWHLREKLDPSAARAGLRVQERRNIQLGSIALGPRQSRDHAQVARSLPASRIWCPAQSRSSQARLYEAATCSVAWATQATRRRRTCTSN